MKTYLTIAAVALACAAVQAEPRLPALTVDELKAMFLACDRASMQGRLSGADAAQCSVIYEALKARAFGGSFEKMLAWTRQAAGVSAVRAE